jgi:hypothetical protein
MWLIVTIIPSILALITAGAIALLIAMWIGVFVSSYESAAFIRLILAALLVPGAGISACWLAVVFVWKTFGLKSRTVA